MWGKCYTAVPWYRMNSKALDMSHTLKDLTNTRFPSHTRNQILQCLVVFHCTSSMKFWICNHCILFAVPIRSPCCIHCVTESLVNACDIEYCSSGRLVKFTVLCATLVKISKMMQQLWELCNCSFQTITLYRLLVDLYFNYALVSAGQAEAPYANNCLRGRSNCGCWISVA